MNVYKNDWEKISLEKSWSPPNIEDIETIAKGDMPGDIIKLSPSQIMKAQKIFPCLLEILVSTLKKNPYERAIIAVCGGSGVGKSEIASLLSYYLNSLSLGSYTLSGDNYPKRIPKYNDAERLRIYRDGGIRGLISDGQYDKNRYKTLKELQNNGNDSNSNYVKKYNWLANYQRAGRNELCNYLGTSKEINFSELNHIISQFKNGVNNIFLKRMGRNETDIWYDEVDFSSKKVLIIEWTHANSNNLKGVDIPILLNSTPQETLEHRRERNRDGCVGSYFTTVILEIEQEMLAAQAPKAKLIVSKNGDFLTYKEYVGIMLRGKC